MGKLNIPISEDRKIRKSAGVSKECQRIGATIAAVAGQLAHDSDGYGVEVVDGSDRTRVHVWAKSGKAAHAEAGAAPPLQQAAMRAK